MELKGPLSFKCQIKRLIDQGMVVNDAEKAEAILKRINYYRFTGYALQFREEPSKSIYKKGTSFESVYKIYEFDEKIRDVLRVYLEKAEVYYRTQVAYGFVMNKCVKPPHDQHYNENNFYNKEGYHEVIDNLKREKKYYRDTLVVRHHEQKYESKMPLWVMVELMSFSDLSKLYSSMYYSEKETIAGAEGISSDTLTNHLHCLAVLRNKCAHAARLYGTRFNPRARFNSSFLRNNPDVNGDSLFAYILILLKRLPNFEIRKEFVNDIKRIMDVYKSCIDMKLVGFPVNYMELFNNNI